MEIAIIVLSLLNGLLIIGLRLLVSWNKKIEKDLIRVGNATASSLERLNDRVTLIIQSLTPKQKEIFDLKVEKLKLWEERKEVEVTRKKVSENEEYYLIRKSLMEKSISLKNKMVDLENKINELYKGLR